MYLSGADLKHAGWNFAVFATVGGSSGLLAWGVYRLAIRVYSQFKRSLSFQQRDDAEKNCRWLGFAAGAGAASFFTPHSQLPVLLLSTILHWVKCLR